MKSKLFWLIFSYLILVSMISGILRYQTAPTTPQQPKATTTATIPQQQKPTTTPTTTTVAKETPQYGWYIKPFEHPWIFSSFFDPIVYDATGGNYMRFWYEVMVYPM